MRRLAACAMLSGALLLSPAVVADTPQEEAKVLAMNKFEQGASAYDDGRYSEAIDLFLEADELVAHPAFPYNIALAYEGLDDTAKALRWMREYLHRSPHAPNIDDAKARILRYEKRLQERGVQQATVRSEPSGATVLIDGDAVGVTPWTGELTPGSHDVELRLRGHVDEQTTLELGAERAAELMVSLRIAPEAPAPEPSAPPPNDVNKPDRGDEGTPLWPFGVALAGGGVVGLGLALGFELARAGSEQDARDAELQVDAADFAATMEDQQLIARIAVGVGAGLLALGATLIVIDLTAGEEDVALRVGPHNVGLSIRL